MTKLENDIADKEYGCLECGQFTVTYCTQCDRKGLFVILCPSCAKKHQELVHPDFKGKMTEWDL